MIRELAPDETHLAFEPMRALRPQLEDPADLQRRVDGVQRREGYRLIAFFDGDRAVAAAGFRLLTTLAWGQVLYCDDLSTLPDHRGQGYARALLDWMREEAQRLGCDQFHLDSGVGPDRTTAHRLYMNAGMRISSHHFQVDVPAPVRAQDESED